MFSSLLNKELLVSVFPLSKQILLPNDCDEVGLNAINRLNFSEFLEYFCRVAYLRY